MKASNPVAQRAFNVGQEVRVTSQMLKGRMGHIVDIAGEKLFRVTFSDDYSTWFWGYELELVSNPAPEPCDSQEEALPSVQPLSRRDSIATQIYIAKMTKGVSYQIRFEDAVEEADLLIAQLDKEVV